MTIVLVHGNPEVAAIWSDLIAELTRGGDAGDGDVVALSPPGFGAPVPAGFGSTAAEYAEWLVAELDAIVDRSGGPVHLIGHDWGGGHVVNAMLRRPDLMRSVTTDIAGVFAPGYTWHDAAQVWRTPGAGEQAVAAMAQVPLDDRVAMYVGLGMTPAAASACAGMVVDMGPSILALYRSADESILADVGREVAAMTNRPSMHVVLATDDHYTGGEPLTTASAEAWGATLHRLDALGHWWMLQDPARAAALVRAIVAAS